MDLNHITRQLTLPAAAERSGSPVATEGAADRDVGSGW